MLSSNAAPEAAASATHVELRVYRSQVGGALGRITLCREKVRAPLKWVPPLPVLERVKHCMHSQRVGRCYCCRAQDSTASCT
jgi:hypothetical protein